MLVIENQDEDRYISISGYKSREEAEVAWKQNSDGNERVVDFVQFDIYELQKGSDSAEIPVAFKVIEALAFVEHSREALEKLLTCLYTRGWNPSY